MFFPPVPMYPESWHHRWPDLTEWNLPELLQPRRQCSRKYWILMGKFEISFCKTLHWHCDTSNLKLTCHTFLWLTMSRPVLLEQPNRRGGLSMFCRLLEVWYSFFPPRADQKSAENDTNTRRTSFKPWLSVFQNGSLISTDNSLGGLHIRCSSSDNHLVLCPLTRCWRHHQESPRHVWQQPSPHHWLPRLATQSESSGSSAQTHRWCSGWTRRLPPEWEHAGRWEVDVTGCRRKQS